MNQSSTKEPPAAMVAGARRHDAPNGPLAILARSNDPCTIDLNVSTTV